MKLASKFKLFTMGAALAVAGASMPVTASPVTGWHGSQNGVSLPDGSTLAAEDGCGIEAFLAILRNPQAAGIDQATTDYHLQNLSALKALSCGGLGGVGDITADSMDLIESLKLALGDQVTDQEAMILEAQAAQDLISALLGVPLVGIDSLAAIDTVAASGDLDSLLAGLISSDALTDVALGSAELQGAADADGINASALAFASSTGGSGAWYGGHLADLGGNGTTSNNKTYGGDAGGGGSGGGSAKHDARHGHHHLRTLAAGSAVSGATAVPLPSGAWAGMILLATLAVAAKVRRAAQA